MYHLLLFRVLGNRKCRQNIPKRGCSYPGDSLRHHAFLIICPLITTIWRWGNHASRYGIGRTSVPYCKQELNHKWYKRVYIIPICGCFIIVLPTQITPHFNMENPGEIPPFPMGRGRSRRRRWSAKQCPVHCAAAAAVCRSPGWQEWNDGKGRVYKDHLSIYPSVHLIYSNLTYSNLIYSTLI